MRDSHPLRRWDDLRRSKRMRKGLFIVPSLFTGANMCAGYFAIAQCIQGAATGRYHHFDYAAIAIGLATIFDFFDGLIARLTNSASDFGKELDSLADVITFGIAPGILAYVWGFRFTEAPPGSADWHVKLVQLGAVVSFLFLGASASRLARFNIAKNPQPSNPGRPDRKYFVGMPTPAGAGVIAATVHFLYGDPIRSWWVSLLWGALILAVAFLEISTWRFISLKGVDFRRQQSFRMFFLIIALIVSIVFWSRYVLYFIALSYLLAGVLARLAYTVRRNPQAPAAPPEPSTT
jgi:CDP-diacylglycerol--serine O-phosphatidyltransferase